MNWPFGKPVVKQHIVPRMVQKDFEKEEKKIQQFEDVNKKLYKDVKRYIEAIDETNKSELKLINNLISVMTTAVQTTTSTSSTTTASMTHSMSIPTLTNSSVSLSRGLSLASDNLNNKIQIWKQAHLGQNQSSLEKLKQTCQYDVVEPMKKLNLIFPSVYAAIKRREQAYNELVKQQQKHEKLQEKERTGANLVKINQQQQNVNLAKQLFQKEHLLLMEELPKFYNSRISYIYPCIQQLIKGQIEFYSTYSTNYERLLEEQNLNAIYNNSSNGSTVASSTTSSSRSISSILSTMNHHQQATSDQPQEEREKTEESTVVQQLDTDIKKLLTEIKSLSIVATD